MFCSLKISGRVPKIPIGRKKIKIHIRLKITVISKNYRLKIAVRVRMYARIHKRVHMIVRTTPDTEHHRKREEHRQSIQTKFAIVGRSTRKKQKKLKKSL